MKDLDILSSVKLPIRLPIRYSFRVHIGSSLRTGGKLITST